MSMKIEVNHDGAVGSKAPWNKDKIIGPKPPLRTKNVWSIRSKLQVEGSLRDLAMFNFAIDSKLRGCDVVSAKVENIAPHGTALDRATVRQRKTGQPVRFELTEQTRESIDAYIRATQKRPGDYLFPSRRFSRPAAHAKAVRTSCVSLASGDWPGPQLLWHP